MAKRLSNKQIGPRSRTYHHIPCVLHILVNVLLGLPHVDGSAAVAVMPPSGHGHVEGISDTAQRYEKESKKGVHGQMNGEKVVKIKEKREEKRGGW